MSVLLLSLGVVLTSLAALILRIVWLLDEKPPVARPERAEAHGAVRVRRAA